MKLKSITTILFSAIILAALSGCLKKETKPEIKNNIKQPPIATTTELQKEKATTTKEIKVKNKIEIDSEFLSVALIVSGEEAIIKSLDKDVVFQNIKNYKEGLSRTYYFNYEPTIFITRIGESGHTTMNLAGEETSKNNIFLKDKKFSITSFIKFPDEDKIIYTVGPGGQEKGKPVFIFDYHNNSIDYVKNDILPNDLISSRIVGWSKDYRFFYVVKMGWEGYDYAGLWKVNIKDKSVKEITGADKITLDKLNVVPYLDLAVGVESKETVCDECMTGKTDGPPSKLNLFDLKVNNYKTLLTSNNFVFRDPVLSPSGDKIFYGEEKSDNIYMINVDGSGKKLIAKGATIHGMDRFGKKIIIKSVEEDIFKILDLEKNTENIISLPNLYNKDRIEFLLCNYPLGYSCLYSK